MPLLVFTTLRCNLFNAEDEMSFNITISLASVTIPKICLGFDTLTHAYVLPNSSVS